MLTSRCDGIGRRDGLKIRWANHPCGFDPRHRHQISTMVLIQDHRAYFFSQTLVYQHFLGNSVFKDSFGVPPKRVVFITKN